MIALDDTDRRLLRLLAEDAGQGAGALGRKVGLSQPAAWRRIRRLEEAGAIRGRRVDLDLAQLGFGVTVFLGVKIATRGRGSVADFANARSLPSPRCRAWSISWASTIIACG